MIYSLEFDLFPEEQVIIEPYKCLKNVHVNSVFKTFKDKGLSIAFLNPNLVISKIISVKHILIAMNKALSIKYSMKDKGQSQDIIKLFLNSLRPEKNNNQSPKDFEYDFLFKEGPGPGILVAVGPANITAQKVNIKEIVHAESEMFEDIGCYADFKALQKVQAQQLFESSQIYGIEDHELELDNDIRASVYNQIVLKNLKA